MPRLEYFIPAGSDAPRWANLEQTHINIRVFFPHLDDTVDYTAAQSDLRWEHSEEIFTRAVAGEFGEILPYEPPPVPVPASVGDRQFFQALYELDYITFEEARAAVKYGDIPEAFNVALNTLPDDVRKKALLSFEGETSFRRDNPITETIRVLMGWTPEALDTLFKKAGSL